MRLRTSMLVGTTSLVAGIIAATTIAISAVDDWLESQDDDISAVVIRRSEGGAR